MIVPRRDILEILQRGTVIPAHPLALDESRRLDERHQRALTRYYLAAGAGGVAVGVHTTQFAIREPNHALLEPVLALASQEVQRHIERSGQPVVRVAGICGPTPQAVAEAELASRLGYDIGLLSLSALRTASITELIAHARQVASVIPLMGFYLQPAVGGRVLPVEFWRRFCEIENVVAIKIAPFNRYQTLEVLRGVAESGRAEQIALYTGNDDNILVDLLTPFQIRATGRDITLRIVGGLLGHWAVWTCRAVEHLQLVHDVVSGMGSVLDARDAGARASSTLPMPPSLVPMPLDSGRRQAESSLLTLAVQITDTNAAFFDAANGFAGCIAGLHEVLRRQGLLRTRNCLDPAEDLSPGQIEEIDRVYAAYPHLNDDEFVAARRDEWLR